jgi:hypothetical protein
MGSHTQSLWTSAAGKLDESDQSLLLTFDQNNDQIKDQNTLDIIDSLTRTTNEAYEICVRKRWQIKLPGKKDKIVVRDLLGKITHGLKSLRMWEIRPFLLIPDMQRYLGLELGSLYRLVAP